MTHPAAPPSDPSESDATGHVRVLREAGLRVTQQRTAIVAVLAAADDHPTADDILAKAREIDDTVSFATVYRTLAVLEGVEAIRKLSFEGAPARYEMTPSSDHDHLVDVDTGELIEIPGGEIARPARAHRARDGLRDREPAHHPARPPPRPRRVSRAALSAGAGRARRAGRRPAC